MSRLDAYPNFTGSAPYWFLITGLGERTPSKALMSSQAEIEDALAICARERKLIDDAIRHGRIPRPNALEGERPRLTPSAERAMPPEYASFYLRCPPGHVEEDFPKRGFSLHDVVSSALRARDFSPVAGEIAEIASGRTVVVAGEGAGTFAAFLRARGVNVIKLRSHRSVLPRRWRRHSFHEWLCATGHDLSGVGAIVFIGQRAHEQEREALEDADTTPPILNVAPDRSGRLQITDMLPGRLKPPGVDAWPKISVVTVSFNQADYLEAAIHSVLDQGYPNLEYIIVDGGSTDGSVEIIERYRDRCRAVIIEPDRGQSDALNKGFAFATGDMLTWLCSDDLLEPGSLERVGRSYRRHGADLVVGGCARIGETRSEEHYRHHSRLPLGRTVRLLPLDILNFMGSWQKGNYFFQPEVFFSRRIWQASGSYLKEHLFYLMDYDLWLRMALAGATVRHIPGMVGASRVHAGQKTQTDRKYLHQMRELMGEYEAMLEAMRAAAAAPVGR